MSTKSSMLAFLGGVAVGAAIALLLAPEKGEVTRKKIGDAVKDGHDKIMDAYKKGKEKLAEAINEGKEYIEDELDMICAAGSKVKTNRK